MAVYTEVSDDQAQALVNTLDLGTLTALQGISGGIENSNFFMTTEKDGVASTHVLTLFERLSHAQLPFYLELMRHLADKGVAVPAPVPNAEGAILHTVCGKPAAVVSKLAGKSQLAPTTVHCAALGETLANMHLADKTTPARSATCAGCLGGMKRSPPLPPTCQMHNGRCLPKSWPFKTTAKRRRFTKPCPAAPCTPTCFVTMPCLKVRP